MHDVSENSINLPCLFPLSLSVYVDDFKQVLPIHFAVQVCVELSQT